MILLLRNLRNGLFHDFCKQLRFGLCQVCLDGPLINVRLYKLVFLDYSIGFIVENNTSVCHV